MKTRIALLLAALALLPLAACAAAETADAMPPALADEASAVDFVYTVEDDGGVAIVLYTGEASDVTLPALLDGQPVTRIGEYAFSGQEHVERVTLPDGVVRIGCGAFEGCSNLREVILPDSLAVIEKSAFSYCERLRRVSIPAGVAQIGEGAFACAGIVDFTVATESTALRAVDGVLYSGDGATLVAYPVGRTEASYAIPEGTRQIAGGAFRGANLQELRMPSSLTRIGDEAFACSALARAAIPEGVIEIGGGAFMECMDLASAQIPSSAARIGNRAFEGCVNLTDLTLAAGLEAIGEYAFLHCVALTEVELPEGVTEIGEGVFCGCWALARINLPMQLTRVEGNPFAGCDALGSIELAADHPTLKMIDGVLIDRKDARLLSYTALATAGEYAVPQGITRIAACAFAGCDGLTRVTLPDSVTEIGYEAFADCAQLERVNIPAGVTNIHNTAFGGCEALTLIVTQGTYGERFAENGALALAYADE